MGFQRRLKDLPDGVTRTKAGHLRYSGGPNRNQYVHRQIVIDLLKETPYSIQLLVPPVFEVHHMDYNKAHNCTYNLLLLDPGFHSALSAIRNRRGDGRWKPKWKAPPLWHPLLDTDLENEEVGGEDEVPF